MKIILTESQLRKVLSELYGKDSSEKLMDKLLDKINNDGITSLTPDEKEMLKKLSKGEKVSEPDELEPEEPEEYDDSNEDGDIMYNQSDMDDPINMFLDVFPDGYEMSIDGSLWKASLQQTDEGVSLFLNDSDKNFITIDFFDTSVDI
jgi:hypothetical protein